MQPVEGLVALCALVAATTGSPNPASAQPITDLAIVYSRESGDFCGDWSWLDQDLAEGVGSQWIYLCARRGPGNPITNIMATSSPDHGHRCPDGWEQIEGDLNEKIDANYVRLCVGRASGEPVVALRLTSSAVNQIICNGSDHQGDRVTTEALPAGVEPVPDRLLEWYQVTTNLNDTVGDRFIHLCFATAPWPPVASSHLELHAEGVWGADEDGNEWERWILNGLDEYSRRLERGFLATRAQWVDALEPGQAEQHTLTLVEGHEYSIHALCDADCDSFEMTLDPPDGISIPTGSFDSRVLRVTPRSTAQYRIGLRMGLCRDAPCYYGVRIHARALRAPEALRRPDPRPW